AMWMTLLAVVAILATLAIVAAIGLGRRALETLSRLGLRLGRRLQAFERFGRSGKTSRQRRHRDLLPRRALDVAQIAAFVVAAKSDRDAVGAGTRGATDAVNILLGNVGQVEVDDM